MKVPLPSLTSYGAPACQHYLDRSITPLGGVCLHASCAISNDSAHVLALPQRRDLTTTLSHIQRGNRAQRIHRRQQGTNLLRPASRPRTDGRLMARKGTISDPVCPSSFLARVSRVVTPLNPLQTQTAVRSVSSVIKHTAVGCAANISPVPMPSGWAARWYAGHPD